MFLACTPGQLESSQQKTFTRTGDIVSPRKSGMALLAAVAACLINELTIDIKYFIA